MFSTVYYRTWIFYRLYQPGRTANVDIETPASITIGGAPWLLEGFVDEVFINEDGLTEVEIAFDRQAFCGTATENGPVEITVGGSLVSGRVFIGTATIKLTRVAGDLTGNSMVDLEDLAILAAYWSTDDVEADIVSDGVVDWLDFVKFAEDWSGR